jgi:hypothetical protein
MRKRKSVQYRTDQILYSVNSNIARGYASVAEAQLWPGSWNGSIHAMNPLWFSDLLGNHGKFDMANLYTTQTGTGAN